MVDASDLSTFQLSQLCALRKANQVSAVEPGLTLPARNFYVADRCAMYRSGFVEAVLDQHGHPDRMRMNPNVTDEEWDGLAALFSLHVREYEIDA